LRTSIVLLSLISFSFEVVRFTFIFFMLQVKTCRPDVFGEGFSSHRALVRVQELGFKFAGPPKIDRNFLSELDLTVSFSSGSAALVRLEWWISLLLGSRADCW
jgi:hypothetical protein